MNESSRAVTGFVACLSAIVLALILGRRARATEPPPVIAPIERVSPTPAPVPMPDVLPDDLAVPWCEASGPRPVPDLAPAYSLTPLALWSHDLPTPAERELVEAAIDGCGQTNRKVADPWMALVLVRLADAAGAPPLLLTAAWCVESSMRTRGATGGPIAGDPMDGVWRARGPFQLHGWWERWCGEYGRRDEFFWSATCYLKRVVSGRPGAEACNEPWRVAEALAANGPRYARMGCEAESKHWRVMANMVARLPAAR